MDFHFNCDEISLSPDSAYLACIDSDKIYVFSSIDNQHIATYRSAKKVRNVIWSPSSELLLCASFRDTPLCVWSISRPDWQFIINNSDLSDHEWFIWSPDSSFLLVVSDLSLRASVFSLKSGTCVFIKFLKPLVAAASSSRDAENVPARWTSCRGSLAFSGDSRLLVCLERRADRDFISVFNAQHPWSLSHNMDSGSSELGGVSWAPDSSSFCVYHNWSSYRLVLYSASCQKLAQLQVVKSPLGVASVVWSSDSQFLVVCGYGNKVALVCRRSWSVLTWLSHTELAVSGHDRLKVFSQQSRVLTGYHLQLALCSASDPVDSVKFVSVNQRPFHLPSVLPPDIKCSAPSTGKTEHSIVATVVKLSADNSYLASWLSSNPRCVWLWSIAENMSLSRLLIHQDSVTGFDWSLRGVRLLTSTRSRHISHWCVDNDAVTLTCPEAAQVKRVSWLSVGERFLVFSGKQAMIFSINLKNQKESQCTS